MAVGRVVAAVDDSPVAAIVRQTATRVAAAMAADLEIVTWQQPSGAAEPITHAFIGDDVVAGVIGARRLVSKADPLGHVAAAAVTNATVPIVVVPPDARPQCDGALSLLAPLDGSRRTEEVLRDATDALATPLGTLRVLHVFDEATVPRFTSSAEDRRIIAEEWSVEHDVGAEGPAQLCVGSPAEAVLRTVERSRPDALILAWHQRLDGGHAEVVRRAIGEAGVPVVLIPIPSAADEGDPAPEREPG